MVMICVAGTATSKIASGGAKRIASSMELKAWPIPFSAASCAAFPLVGSATAMTGKFAFA